MKPQSYMNLSGGVVRKYVDFFKIPIDNILIISDDLDLPVGTYRLKPSGSSGGHNGLKDIVPHIGSNFHRLRIGIGHPGSKERVSGHVLSKAPSSEQNLMDDAIAHALSRIQLLVNGDTQQAMNQINAYKPN